MIIKNANDKEFYRPGYVTDDEMDLMLTCYRQYEYGSYHTMNIDDWKRLCDVVIIWVAKNGTVSITMPQSPQGADLTAWLEHVYRQREYYISADKLFMVIKE